jgi:cell division transport system ATP-binding protein
MLEIKNLTKSYDNSKALENVTFTIKKGEFVSLVGPSGAGKSTLIRLILCEEKPTQGNIFVADRDITLLKPRELPFYRRKIGVIFQDYKLLPHKTVWENVAFALEVCDVEDYEIKNRVPKILSLVGLSNKHKNYPDELSGGERQRVAIARALVHNPKILIADEPTGNLDPVNTWEIMEILHRVNMSGTMILLATHNKEVVDRIRKRVISMKKGKIVGDQKIGKYII